MALDDLKARLDQVLADLSRKGDPRSQASGLHDAMVDTKVALAETREALSRAETELAAERQRLADTERRGVMADQIDDRETAELARVWSAKHRERVDLLERKVVVLRDELAYATRQYDELHQAYRQARLGIHAETPGPAPDVGLDFDTPVSQSLPDREAQQRLVQEQLAALKRKLGRDA